MTQTVTARGRWMALVAAFLGWMFDGVEIGLFPIAGRPALRELLNATGPDADRIIGPWFSAIVAAFLLGAALGGVVFGWLGDRLGRVRAMILSVLTYSVFSGLCAHSINSRTTASISGSIGPVGCFSSARRIASVICVSSVKIAGSGGVWMPFSPYFALICGSEINSVGQPRASPSANP